ncbi:MAG: CNNM domain-containing protein [Acutalibacteraceae bacterium]
MSWMSFCRGLLLELKGETCTFMENGILWQSLGIIICLVLSGFFSASETAFTSLNRIRMKNKAMNGDRRAERALKLADRYDALLSTILIGNNIVNIVSASLGTLAFTTLLGPAVGVPVSTAVITIAVLIFGEISPKSLAKEHAEGLAMTFAPALQVRM